ncbi:MAG: hypothetical protein Kow0042_14250 [Calditrichia bacterium]
MIKLDIPTQAYSDSTDAWLTAYKNNMRHNAVSYDVKPPYKIEWDARFRSVITDHPLAVDRYLIFTVRNGTLAFFDIQTGQKIGDGHLAPAFLHIPTLSENILYYASNLGKKNAGAFDLRRLDKLWESKLPDLNTSPLLIEDRIYIGSNQGQFFCLNKKNGETIWTYQKAGQIFGNPAAVNGKIYLANVKGGLMCLNADTGKELWKTQLKENIYAGPTVTRDRVFIGSTAGIMYGVDARSGSILWEYKTAGSIYGNAAYLEETLFFGCNDNFVYALNAINGSELWRFKTNGIVNTAPLVGPTMVYVASWDKNFYVLDRFSGNLIYRQEFNQSLKSSPIIYDKRIFLQVANDRIYCLSHDKSPSKAGLEP